MITWTETETSVSDLIPYERNPRLISEKAFRLLKESISELGYHQRIICQPDRRVIGGHQRIRALTELGIKKVKILVPDRELTVDEFKKLLIQDNLEFGEFDYEMLAADFDVDDLIKYGIPESQLIGGNKEKEPEEKHAAEGLIFAVVVSCTDEMHQLELLEKFQAEGLKCKALIS